MEKKRFRVIIMGAAGRDFHNFNVFFRDNKLYEVVGFTTAQILKTHRMYPKKLAGRLYPGGIHIHPESELPILIKNLNVDMVVLSYSDLAHEDVMHKASLCLASGANFMLLGPKDTMLKSSKPVISVCAVRTGSGKSQTTKFISRFFKQKGYKVVVIRHPMPYGDLEKQEVQRFAKYDDLKKHDCTIEEREEYEPHLRNGIIVYAGVDYEKILRSAEKEADIIIWDGGNNDFPFYKPDLQIVVADPHRPGHEIRYHPGETNFRMADIILINKVDSAPKSGIVEIEQNARLFNPTASIIKAKSRLIFDSSKIRGKKAIVIEDGPTLTHGEMSFGAGMLAARRLKLSVVDAQKSAVGSIRQVYKDYPKLKNILPAMGYSMKQVAELQQTIDRAKCDMVIDGSPVNLSRLIRIKKPIMNVEYELDVIGRGLVSSMERFERRFIL